MNHPANGIPRSRTGPPLRCARVSNIPENSLASTPKRPEEKDFSIIFREWEHDLFLFIVPSSSVSPARKRGEVVALLNPSKRLSVQYTLILTKYQDDTLNVITKPKLFLSLLSLALGSSLILCKECQNVTTFLNLIPIGSILWATSLYTLINTSIYIYIMVSSNFLEQHEVIKPSDSN